MTGLFWLTAAFRGAHARDRGLLRRPPGCLPPVAAVNRGGRRLGARRHGRRDRGHAAAMAEPAARYGMEAVFAAAAAWLSYQTGRARRHNAVASPWRCPHPVPHLVESAAMRYMLAALPGSWPGLPARRCRWLAWEADARPPAEASWRSP